MIKRKPSHKGFGRSKKVDAWSRVRAELKKEFYEKQIVTCELCGYSDALSFAHRLKRRYITDEVELRQVALLCMDIGEHKGCHSILEIGDKQVMFDVISDLIERRG
jgi:hypothetical protein